jgi:uncharacterized protein (DUF1778 family)
MTKSSQLTIRLTASQNEALKALAAKCGRGVSNFLIWKLGLDKKQNWKNQQDSE